MNKINIKVKLDNKDMTYHYEGVAYTNKDIIEYHDKEFNYKEYHYIFDKKVKRLIKSCEDTTITLDFHNEQLKINDNNRELKMDIDVEKIDINGNNIEIIYKVDKDEIKYEIKEVK